MCIRDRPDPVPSMTGNVASTKTSNADFFTVLITEVLEGSKLEKLDNDMLLLAIIFIIKSY